MRPDKEILQQLENRDMDHSEAEGRGQAAWFFLTTSRLVNWFNILSYITGAAPDLQCKFENH